MGPSQEQFDAARRAFEAALKPHEVQSALTAAVRAQSDLAKMSDRWAPSDVATGVAQVLHGSLAPGATAPTVADSIAALGGAGRVPSVVERVLRGAAPDTLASADRFGAATSALSAVSAQQAMWQRISQSTVVRPGTTSAFDTIAAGFRRAADGDLGSDLVGRAATAGVLDARLRADLTRNDSSVAALIAGLAPTRTDTTVLQYARTATTGLVNAATVFQARLDAASSLADRAGALGSGMATADMLGGRIERVANRLDRLAAPGWGVLPVDTLRALDALSQRSVTGPLDTRDLLAMARGAYAVTALAARAAAFVTSSTAGGAAADVDETDDVVEDWAGGPVSADIHDALAALHPRLGEKLRGAWNAYRRRGPDYLGQAGTSAVELIDHALRLMARRDDVLAWGRDTGLTGDMYVTRDGNATVRLKVLYVLRDREMAADAVEAQVKALSRARKLIQESKHGLDFDDDLMFGQQLVVVENVFAVLLRC